MSQSALTADTVPVTVSARLSKITKREATDPGIGYDCGIFHEHFELVMANLQRIVEIGEDGMWLALDDGSRWTVKPEDCRRMVLWCEMQRIWVERESRGGYRLRNLDVPVREDIRVIRRLNRQ